MPYRVVQELKLLTGNITGLEEALDRIVRDGKAADWGLNTLDAGNDPLWVANRDSFLNTLTNASYTWDSDRQILTRVQDWETLDHYDDWNSLVNLTFTQSPENARTLTVISEGDI